MVDIRLENVSYSYKGPANRDQTALENVSFTVSEGEVVVVLGPNGAGKSTLLHLIMGLKFADSGAISIGGVLMTRKNADKLRNKIGLLFQDPDDQVFMPTVQDDIAFGPLNQGLGEKRAGKRVAWAMRRLCLDGYEDRAPHALSYGERKKVAIAGLLAMKPDIILLDEPTANLDPKTRRELILMILKLGKTAIITTHDVDFATEISRRTVLIKGKCIADGPMSQIFNREELLSQTSLELPAVARLFRVLGAFGYPYQNLPLSMDDAIREITRTIEKTGGHIHLHMHVHSHELAPGHECHEHDKL